MKAEKCRSLVLVKGEVSKKEPMINGIPIVSVADSPIKYLGKTYDRTLTDREQAEETLGMWNLIDILPSKPLVRVADTVGNVYILTWLSDLNSVDFFPQASSCCKVASSPAQARLSARCGRHENLKVVRVQNQNVKSEILPKYLSLALMKRGLLNFSKAGHHRGTKDLPPL